VARGNAYIGSTEIDPKDLLDLVVHDNQSRVSDQDQTLDDYLDDLPEVEDLVVGDLE
jgi:hypothetical protein